jgi:hypothetical protein
VRIRLTGPSHMILVVRDGVGGVLEDWSLTPTLPPPRHEGVRFVMLNAGSCGDVQPGEAREDHARGCSFEFMLSVRGHRLLDVAAYGHYVDMGSTPALLQLESKLPVWAIGAEWTHFSSMLVQARG